ncbi:MAG TPA: hypothetical protein VN253_04270, partial [Kofleriaceae bacterium]|nr:hypothetical protein [Kofleriaceae bacterium]
WRATAFAFADTAPDRKLGIAAVWSDLRELRRLRVEVIPIRRHAAPRMATRRPDRQNETDPGCHLGNKLQ